MKVYKKHIITPKTVDIGEIGKYYKTKDVKR